MTFFHGIQITEDPSGSRPLDALSQAVIGIVCTADDADASVFPLNKAVLVDSIPRVLIAAGDTGTLSATLRTIAAQASPIVVVVRVSADSGNALDTEGGDPFTNQQGVTIIADADPAAMNAAVIGATDGNSFTGMQALLAAPTQLGVTPKILGCPGLDSKPVAVALATLAQKLRAMSYVMAVAADEAHAAAYRNTFAAREIMVLWPEMSGTFEGKAVATALGIRAALDAAQGPHKSISNTIVNGVTGLRKDVIFNPTDLTIGAGYLNANHVTTVIHVTGYRFWGNRTCSADPLFAFEPSVRMNYLLQDTIRQGLLPYVDRPLTAGLVRDIEESINALIRGLISKGWLIGGSCWYDKSKNDQSSLGNGQLVLSYDFTVPSPAEGIGLTSTITDDYYASFADLLG